MSENMNIKLKIWRQQDAGHKGRLESYEVPDVSPHMSFLEMIDVLNEGLQKEGKDPVAIDSDCREGICGSCGVVIDGTAHGPEKRTATCQLHMRHYKDHDEIVVEPFRARAFEIIKDLVVDREAMDTIIRAGGHVSVNTGSAPDANNIPIPTETAEEAFDYATCIGCGACIAACPNASAALFGAAKIAQFALLPQGHPERAKRVQQMVGAMDASSFGNCSNHAECEAVCPKAISIRSIAIMRREAFKAIPY